MSAFVYRSNLFTTAASDSAVNLTGGDQVYVLQGITVGALGADASGIVSTGGGNTVDVYGTVLSADGSGIELAGRLNRVYLGQEGVISSFGPGIFLRDGGGSISSYGTITQKDTGFAIEAQDDSRIVNHGAVDALFGSGIQADGGFNTILNHGDITSRFYGVRMAGGENKVVNHGDISSIGDIGTGYGVVLASSDWQQNWLTNTGRISGADAGVLGGSGSEIVLSRGQIDGHVLLNRGNDILSNSGQVNGDVVLDFGDDRYIGTDGSVSGKVLGGAGADILLGGSSRDKMFGQGGDDRLFGDAGNDVLRGGGGQGRLFGGAGRDVVGGGAGDDVLSGGTEADRFVFRANSGKDLITDFEVGQDVIDLRALGLSSFAELNIRYHADRAVLTTDADPSILLIDNVSNLDADDFLI